MPILPHILIMFSKIGNFKFLHGWGSLNSIWSLKSWKSIHLVVKISLEMNTASSKTTISIPILTIFAEKCNCQNGCCHFDMMCVHCKWKSMPLGVWITSGIDSATSQTPILITILIIVTKIGNFKFFHWWGNLKRVWSSKNQKSVM